MNREQQAIVGKIGLLVRPALTASDDSTLGETALRQLVEGELLALFSHIDIEFASLAQIERDQVQFWMPASSNYLPHTLFRLLRDRVGGQARQCGAFGADGLTGQLRADDGVDFSAPPDIDRLRESVIACGALLRTYKRTIAATGQHLPRAITDDIVAWVREPTSDRQVGLLLDQAGAGKSVILRDALTAVEEAGEVVMAIKADQQLSSVDTTEDLQRALGLPVSAERAAALLAAHGPVVVLIDQIDALSLTLLARDQRAIDLMLGLVARLRLIPGVRLVIACRTFDRNTDPRLKRLDVAREFIPVPLADDVVAGVVGEIGVEHTALSAGTRELLRTPHHLDLFARLAKERGGAQRLRELCGLSTLQDLYALLWHDLVRRPDLAAPPIAEREEVLRIMTARMARDQRTTVPQTLFATPENARLLPAANWLASSGILVSSSITWSFLHQTFFDYCYARNYVESGARLSETLLRSEQGLFARSQLTQVLAYLRANDEATYIYELNVFLRSEGLRFHLRDLLLNWVGASPDPTDGEVVLVRRLLLTATMRPQLLGALRGNIAWLARLAGEPMRGFLALDDEAIEREILPYLASLIDVDQAAVIAAIEPFLGRSEAWNNRISWLFMYVRRWENSEAANLFERLLRLSPLYLRQHAHEMEKVAEAFPLTGCHLIALALEYIHDAESPAGGEASAPAIASIANDFGGRVGNDLGDAIEAARTRAARPFLDMALPWLERTLGTISALVDDLPFFPHDLVSYAGRFGAHDVARAVVRGIIGALIDLAREDPAEFRRAVDRLDRLQSETPQTLLAQVYREVPDICADEAARFLLADRRRLHLGESEQLLTRRLLASIYPYLSPARWEEMEACILAYAPIWRSPRPGVGAWWRIEQLYLLQAIPLALLSERGRDRLRELERKFPGVRASDSPSLVAGGWVGPPITEEEAIRMSDAAWLRAMSKYRGAISHKEFLKGGAAQLSGVLAALVRKQPERFARLAELVPVDIDIAYVRAFLNGLAESTAPSECFFGVARRFVDHPDRERTRAIAWALEKRAAGGIPTDLVDLLKCWVRSPAGDEDGTGRDPYSRYFNTDRGSALRALMRALEVAQTDEARERQWALLESLASDPSDAMRIGAIEETLQLLHADRGRAISLFERFASGRVELLATHQAQEFVYFGLYRAYARMQPFIRAMLQSDDSACQQRGAEIAATQAISPTALEGPEAIADARRLAAEALDGPVPWRVGVARIYAANVADAPAGDVSDAITAGLHRLVSDADREVRRQVGGMFGSLRDDHITTLRALIESFAISPALHDDTGQFAEFLWQHGMVDPDWALAVVEAALQNERSTGDAARFRDGEELIRLVLRIYVDPTSDHLRERAMDAFDALMARFTGDALRALEDWDRQ